MIGFGKDDPVTLNEGHVAEACERVRNLAFVGITDLWDASMCLFHHQLGGQLRQEERLNNRPGNYEGAAVTSADCGDRVDEQLFLCGLEVFLERVGTSPCKYHMKVVDLDLPRANAMLAAFFGKHGLAQ